MLQVHGADSCPLAHRVRALLAHLKVPFEMQPGIAGDPLLVDGKFELRDTSAICRYVVEKRGWEHAFADKLEARAREWMAMARWDAVIAPAFVATRNGGTLDAATRKAVLAEVKELAKTVQATGKTTDHLLALWVAPWWLEIRACRTTSPLADLLGEWVDVKAWLDAAAALPAVRGTRAVVASVS